MAMVIKAESLSTRYPLTWVWKDYQSGIVTASERIRFRLPPKRSKDSSKMVFELARNFLRLIMMNPCQQSEFWDVS
jgi:hypothetical protein